MSASFSRLLCRIGLHAWKNETKGYQFEGMVYPVFYRTCLNCSRKQKKIFDSGKESAIWADITELK